MPRNSSQTFFLLLSMIAALIVLISTTGCAHGRGADTLTRYSYAKIIMGVEARITLFAETEPEAVDAARAAFDRMTALEDVMTDWRDDSEVMRLVRGPVGIWTPVSRDLHDVLAFSQEIASKTDGAFDVTIGPLVRLWREARRDGALPDTDARAAARARVGWRRIQLRDEPPAVRLGRDDLHIDFGGVGKGWAADEAVALLRAAGLPRCAVEIGGDFTLGDPPPGRDGWRIGVDPFDDGVSASMWILDNVGVATSGDQVQFVEIDGVRYSHLVDPATGVGLRNQPAVTVIAPTGALADALASAMSVLPADRRDPVARRFDDVAVTVVERGAAESGSLSP